MYFKKINTLLLATAVMMAGHSGRWALVTFVAVLAGCATNVDGSITLGALESHAWWDTASTQTIKTHFDSLQPHELCIKWAANPYNERMRAEISKSLMRRNLNPLLCY